MIVRAAIGFITASAVGIPGFVVTTIEGPTLMILELVPGTDIGAIIDDFGLTLLDSIESHDLYLVAVPAALAAQEMGGFEAAQEMGGLDADPRIEEAEVDDDATAPQAADGDTQPIFFYVPSGEFDGQFALSLDDIAGAHASSTGTGVVVAVLDTGADIDHELLAGRIAPGGYDFVDDDTDVAEQAIGLDVDGDGVQDELHGHGTFVAGIVATVAPSASILPIRVLDSEGYADVFRVVQGIYHAIDNDADIINLSLGTKSHNHILRNAVADAAYAGIIVVTAVGDDDREHPVQMPAGEEATIAVAATDYDDVKSDFSNFGGHVSLTSPGQEVVSSMPDGAYARASGTSISTAFVAGTVALMRSADPTLTQIQIENLLYLTAHEIDSLNPGLEGLLGAGRLDVAAAVAEAVPTGPGPSLIDVLGPGMPAAVNGRDLLIFLGIDWRQAE
ncbi:MAG: S8 family serine peptidase [Phycisphaerales bacterium]